MVPYLIIWSVTAVYCWLEVGQPGCTGLCAAAGGFLAYLAMAAAVILTALVALTEVALMRRHRRQLT